jgi:hypothetical protein
MSKSKRLDAILLAAVRASKALVANAEGNGRTPEEDFDRLDRYVSDAVSNGDELTDYVETIDYHRFRGCVRRKVEGWYAGPEPAGKGSE